MEKGIKASPGIAIGRVCLLIKELEIEKRIVSDNKKEIKRLETAIEKSQTQLEHIKENATSKMGEGTAAIFEAHIMMLNDPEFIPEIKSVIINEGVNSEYAVFSVVEKYGVMFDSMEDTYLKERAADVRDVGNRMVANLMGRTIGLNDLREDSVIVAKDLTPSDTAQMDKDKVRGFLTDEGGRTSHSAIMARTLEIPAVVGLGDITSKVKDGDTIIVDGNEGIAYINPDENTLNEYLNKKKNYEEYRQKLRDLIDLPAKTPDDRKVYLEANIGTPDDIDGVLKNGAEGVGLFRTEFLYMNRDSLPTEDEQFEAYKKVASSLKGKNVTIRTLDIGGDKELGYLGMEKEQNPFLGWRAIRFCLDRTDIFKTQLRAILRASLYGKVSVMYPMISDVKEVRRANSVLNEVKKELDLEGVKYDKNIDVGIMVEIPSAAVMADILAKEVDFFSIGTNDLTQYTLAVDRGNRNVKDYYNYFNVGVLRLIKNCIDESHKNGIYTAMCGEMAGDTEATKILLGLGLDAFSMSASSIPMVKDIIRNTKMEDAKVIAKEAVRY